MTPHVRPFARKDAVHHTVADGSVAAGDVMAHDTIAFRSECFYGPLRAEVKVVGPQSHDFAAQRFEGVAEQQQLASRVDVGSLAALRVPGVADLHAIDSGNDVVIARRTDDSAAFQLPHSPREHMAQFLAVKSLGDITAHTVGSGDGCEPQLPQAAIGGGGSQAIVMLVG